MRVLVFSAMSHDRRFLAAANEAASSAHELVFVEAHLDVRTAGLVENAECVCAFVNDSLDAPVLEALARAGVRLAALRCAGFNNVDLAAAQRLGVSVARVPAYSPHSVAEHAVALMLSLDRKIHRAYARVREGNFALEGLLGFDLRGRTVGVIGTGRIGIEVTRIMTGFGCHLLGSDLAPDPKFDGLGGRYVPLPELLALSDIVTLHCPLTPDTRHLIDAAAIARMKAGVMLINTS